MRIVFRKIANRWYVSAFPPNNNNNPPQSRKCSAMIRSQKRMNLMKIFRDRRVSLARILCARLHQLSKDRKMLSLFYETTSHSKRIESFSFSILTPPPCRHPAATALPFSFSRFARTAMKSIRIDQVIRNSLITLCFVVFFLSCSRRVKHLIRFFRYSQFGVTLLEFFHSVFINRKVRKFSMS